MALYDYRTNYYTGSGLNINLIGYPVKFISPVVSAAGDGTRLKPFKLFPNMTNSSNSNSVHVLANGMYRDIPINLATSGSIAGDSTLNYYMVGNGIKSTVLKALFNMSNTMNGNRFGAINVYANDMTFTELNINVTGLGSATNMYFTNCYIMTVPVGGVIGGFTLNKCVVGVPNTTNRFTDNGQNSYIDTDITARINTLALYGGCNVTLDTQDMLTAYLDTYAAFNDCRFKIGNESGWTALNGATEADYRADFVARCQAQGFTVPTGSEFGDIDMSMYRWIFANDASKNGVPTLNGIIHNFEKRRFITFGYETKREGFTISTDKTTKDSFNPANPTSLFQIQPNALSFPASTDITNRVAGSATSGVKWLGGKVRITDLNVIHNMPLDFGVMVDNTSTIDFTPVASGNIQTDEIYIVRSTDKEYAGITYNNVNYNTALSNNVQVFKGVEGQTTFTVTDGNPVIYPLTDFVQHQTVEVRIVNKIPSGNIQAGTALTSGYWYIVEHDTDQSNTTHYVTYGGANYKVGSSFLASGTASFTKSGNVHLRRCWHNDFDWESMTPNSLDYNFWLNEQKPKWCKIVLGDTPRCIMVANSNRYNEMQTDANGDYITTGNPAFYPLENGNSGIALPTFHIQGTFMQMRLTVTTTNPM